MFFFQLFYHFEAFSSTEEDSFAYLYQVSYHSSLQLHSCSFRLRFGYIFISIFFLFQCIAFGKYATSSKVLWTWYYCHRFHRPPRSKCSYTFERWIFSTNGFFLLNCFFFYFDYVKKLTACNFQPLFFFCCMNKLTFIPLTLWNEERKIKFLFLV